MQFDRAYWIREGKGIYLPKYPNAHILVDPGVYRINYDASVIRSDTFSIEAVIEHRSTIDSSTGAIISRQDYVVLLQLQRSGRTVSAGAFLSKGGLHNEANIRGNLQTLSEMTNSPSILLMEQLILDKLNWLDYVQEWMINTIQDGVFVPKVKW